MDVELVTDIDNIHQTDVHLVVQRDWYVDFIVDLEYNNDILRCRVQIHINIVWVSVCSGREADATSW